MSLVAGEDGYEPVQLQPEPAMPPRSSATMFRRRSARPSRRAVLHLQTADDAPVPPDLGTWFTERGFHFYVAGLRSPGRPRRTGRRGEALAAAFAELDTKCEHLRTADGIDNVIVTAHGEGALVAALWCAAERPVPKATHRSGGQSAPRSAPEATQRPRRQSAPRSAPEATQGPGGQSAPRPSGQDVLRPGSQADALIMYAPVLTAPAFSMPVSSHTVFSSATVSRAVRRGLDIPCPVLVIGGSGGPGGSARGRRWAGLGSRPEPAAASQLGRHVTWLRPTDGEARPDAEAAADRGQFFDEMGRWLGAYMYGRVRDQLL
jgi:hypothetical protein